MDEGYTPAKSAVGEPSFVFIEKALGFQQSLKTKTADRDPNPQVEDKKCQH